MALLENIQSLCEEHGTSVPKLEQTLRFGKGTIYKWSVSSPTVDKLQKVADYFNVPTDYLLGRAEPDMPVDEPELFAIQRAAKKMSPVNKKKMLNIVKAAFEDAFSEDE